MPSHSPTPEAACSAHPRCTDQGFLAHQDCCPHPESGYLGCCDNAPNDVALLQEQQQAKEAEEAMVTATAQMRSLIVAVSALFGLLVLVIWVRLVYLMFGGRRIKQALRNRLWRVIYCCRPQQLEAEKKIPPPEEPYEPPPFAARIEKLKLVYILMAGLDFMTDLWALLELDKKHRPWGVRAMGIALGTNLLVAVFGFFRVARKENLLNKVIVRKTMWEHTIITVISVTNLDTLNMLAWKARLDPNVSFVPPSSKTNF